MSEKVLQGFLNSWLMKQEMRDIELLNHSVDTKIFVEFVENTIYESFPDISTDFTKNALNEYLASLIDQRKIGEVDDKIIYIEQFTKEYPEYAELISLEYSIQMRHGNFSQRANMENKALELYQQPEIFNDVGMLNAFRALIRFAFLKFGGTDASL